MAAIATGPIQNEETPSLGEILSRYELNEMDLNRECDREVLNKIALKLGDWEMVGHFLGFTLEKLRDINRDYASQELCKIALFDAWAKREGREATYFKLAGVLHGRQRCDLVELLCEELKSKLSLVPRRTAGNVVSNDMPSGEHNAQSHQVGSSTTGMELLHTIASSLVS